MDLTKETHAISYYGTLIIGTAGIVTNILNIKVCYSSEFIQDTTMGFFNVRLSIANILSIIMVSFVSYFPQSIGGKPLVLTSDTACKIIPYLTRVFCQMSSWLMVMKTHDYLYTLTLYNRANYNPNLERPCLTIPEHKLGRRVRILVMIIFIINTPNLYFNLDTQANTCTADPSVVNLRDIISRTSFGLIPFCLQVFMNIRLTDVIRRQNERIIRNFDFARQQKSSFNLVKFNFIYIASEFIGSIFAALIKYYGVSETTLIATQSPEAAISAICFVCSIFVSMFFLGDCLFLVNMVTNKIFRQEALRIFIY